MRSLASFIAVLLILFPSLCGCDSKTPSQTACAEFFENSNSLPCVNSFFDADLRCSNDGLASDTCVGAVELYECLKENSTCIDDRPTIPTTACLSEFSSLSGCGDSDFVVVPTKELCDLFDSNDSSCP